MEQMFLRAPTVLLVFYVLVLVYSLFNSRTISLGKNVLNESVWLLCRVE